MKTLKKKAFLLMLCTTLFFNFNNFLQAQCNSVEVAQLPVWQNCFVSLPDTELSNDDCSSANMNSTNNGVLSTKGFSNSNSLPTELIRGANYSICGTFPGDFNSSHGRIEIYHRVVTGQIVILGQTITQYAHIPIDKYANTRNTDYRFSRPYTAPSPCDLLSKNIDALVIVYFKYQNGQARARSKRVIPIEEMEIYEYPFPTPKAEALCKKGVQTITIENPNNAPKLYLVPASVNLTFDPTNPTSIDTNFLNQNNVITINKNPTDNKFYFTKDFQTSETYLMGYGSLFPNCPLYQRLSPMSPLVLLMLELDVDLHTIGLSDTTYLQDCSGVGYCNLPGVNYELLSMSSPIIDSLKQIVLDNLNSIPYLSNSQLDINLFWEDSTKTTFASTDTLTIEQRVCFDDLNKGPDDPADYDFCRTYTLQMNAEVSATFDHPDLLPFSFADIDCNQSFLDRTVCQEMLAPMPKIAILCGDNDKACMPCETNMRGIEFWTSAQGGTLIQGPPPSPDGTTGAPGYYNYWKCGYTELDRNGNPRYYNPVDYTERFCYNQPVSSAAGVQNVVWMNYISREGKRSKRVPLALIKVDVLQNPLHANFELFKSTDPSNPCMPGSSVPLDTVSSAFTDNILDQIDDMNLLISEYGQIDMSYALSWKPKEHTTYEPTLNLNMVCYDDLPDGAGTCRDYENKAEFYFSYSIKNPCDSSISYTEWDTCHQVIREYTICKKMYPPLPAVFYICNNSPTEICLQTINDTTEISDSYVWDYYISPTNTANDPNSQLDSLCETRNWYQWKNDFITSQGYDYLPNVIRFSVRSKVDNNGNIRTSDPVPVILVLSPFDGSIQTLTTGLFEPTNANEDDFGNYCTSTNPEFGTYHNLDYDTQSFIDTLQGIIDLLEINVPGMEITPSVGVSWEDDDYYEPVNRVCYGNLRPGYPTNDDRGRFYYGNLNTNLHMCLDLGEYSEAGQNLDEAVLNQPQLFGLLPDSTVCFDQICSDRVSEQYVYKFQGVNVPDVCTIANPTLPTNIQGCNSIEYNQVCIGDSVLIGNGNPAGITQYNNYSFDWYDNSIYTNVLSDTTIRTPMWQYNPGMTQNQMFWYYCDATEQLTNTTTRHCVSIAICQNCPNQISIQNTVIDQTTYNIEVIPNSVDNRLRFIVTPEIAENQKNDEFHYKVFDNTGRIQFEGQGKLNEFVNYEPLLLSPGTYHLVIDGIGHELFKKE